MRLGPASFDINERVRWARVISRGVHTEGESCQTHRFVTQVLRASRNDHEYHVKMGFYELFNAVYAKIEHRKPPIRLEAKEVPDAPPLRAYNSAYRGRGGLFHHGCYHERGYRGNFVGHGHGRDCDRGYYSYAGSACHCCWKSSHFIKFCRTRIQNEGNGPIENHNTTAKIRDVDT